MSNVNTAHNGLVMENNQVESQDHHAQIDTDPARPPLLEAIAALPLTPVERPSSAAIKRAITVITRKSIVEANLPEPAPDTDQLASTAQLPTPPASSTPWPLQQFFAGDIELDTELGQRFPNMPVMSRISFREMGEKRKRGVATLMNQDGAAQVIIDVDSSSRMIQMSFTYGAMLTLRFRLVELSDMDRTRWLELMQREQGGLAFLWGAARWEQDYVICVARRHFTNWYAFSPNGFEAGVRMTPDATRKLLKWLVALWTPQPEDTTPDHLLTW